MWPVATETVVLSLPRMIGTNNAPCVVGFFEIISLRLSVYSNERLNNLLLVSKPNHQTLSFHIGDCHCCRIAKMVHSRRKNGNRDLPTCS